MFAKLYTYMADPQTWCKN